ncbi:hypothetical protein FQN57_002627 [Myotisia sp. PD_48]|nr:hypothetical protein FQN57_002627 [Myotisia sp. PD_48]
MALQLLLLAAGAGLLFITLLRYARNVVFSPLNVFPGPAVARITNLWRFLDVFSGHAHLTHIQLHKSYGSAVRIGPNFIILDEPDLIPVIYGIDGKYAKGPFYEVGDIQVGRKKFPNLFSSRDERWHTEQLRPIKRCYDMSNILKFEPTIDRVILKFIDILINRFAAEKERTVCDLGKYLSYFAWDAVAEITFGAPLGFLDEGGDVHGLLRGSQESGRYLARFGQLPTLDKILTTNPFYQTESAFSHPVQFSIQKIEERRAPGYHHAQSDQEDFLAHFLEIQKASGEEFDMGKMLTWLTINVVAGSDTTASALNTIMYHLIKNPVHIDSLRRELSELKDATFPLPYSKAKSLPFLDAVINEGFRIQPSVGLALERVVPDGPGLVLPDGRIVPSGTIVGMNAHALGRHQGIFGENADFFDPTRWLQRAGENAADFKARYSRMKQCSLTFGAGSRGCLGKHVSYLEIYKLVPSLVQAFQMSLVNPKQNCLVLNDWFLFAEGLHTYIRQA